MPMEEKPGSSISIGEAPGPALDMQLPEHLPVSVIVESRPAKSIWVDRVWRAVAVTIGHAAIRRECHPRLIRSSGDIEQYLCPGLQVTLYKDECESYYHNLMAPSPQCYVVAHLDDNEAMPEPFLITMSFDEAHAYLEGEDDIFEVDVPPELYRWTEAFVLVHYAPEKRVKRKRKNWSKHQSKSSRS